MNEDAFWEQLIALQMNMDRAYQKALRSKDLIGLSNFEQSVTEVSRLLANRHMSNIANTAEQLANHEKRLRRIERKVHGLED